MMGLTKYAATVRPAAVRRTVSMPFSKTRPLTTELMR